MSVIRNVWTTAEHLMKAPVYATVDLEECKKIAEKNQPLFKDLMTASSNKAPANVGHKEVLYELLASSVNYCYWYGSPRIRPGDASSVKMYELLDRAFSGGQDPFSAFKSLLIESRFPLCADRIRHIDEVAAISNFCYKVTATSSLEEMLLSLIRLAPGFAADVFLKRAFLFFSLLYRKYGWFKEQIQLLPVPADYQLPKMLRWLKCIKYSEELSGRIARCELIPSGSLPECEIRAATLLSCREIAKAAGCRSADVDNFLWTIRKACTDNFHLTITTDY